MKTLSIRIIILSGSHLPYLNYELVNTSLEYLPAGSALEKIEGGSHVVFLEKPHYQDFQNRLITYLMEER